MKMKRNSQMVFVNEGEKEKRKNRCEKEDLDLSEFKRKAGLIFSWNEYIYKFFPEWM